MSDWTLEQWKEAIERAEAQLDGYQARCYEALKRLQELRRAYGDWIETGKGSPPAACEPLEGSLVRVASREDWE